jgi:hypothetical protein
MGEKIIKPERRQLERRQGRLAALGDAVSESTWVERRVHCWDLETACTEDRRKRCAAHFVRRNCWDLWAAEFFPAGRRPCCHPDLDCSDCPVALDKFGGPISVYVAVPARDGRASGSETSVAIHCGHLYSLKEPATVRGGETEQKLIFRCQRRPGIQLHGSYVSEVCGTAEHRECTFHD